MSKEKNIRVIRLIYAITLSISLALFAFLLCVSCMEIYRSGESPFTPASVAAAWRPIAPFAYAVILWVIVGFFLIPTKSGQASRLRGAVSVSHTLKILSAKLDTSACTEETRKKIRFERILRTAVTVMIAVAFAIGGCVALLFSFNADRFPADDPNGEVLRGALTVLCCLALPFVWAVTALFINQSSRQRELDTVKAALRETAGKPKGTVVEAPKTCSVCTFFQNNRGRILTIVRVVVLVIGAALLIFGISNGGARDVVQKAIKICRECIGLG